MLATYDLPAVRRFATELDEQRSNCNGEGMFCSDLDAAIGCLADVCLKLYGAITEWAREVFAGRVPFEREVEVIFKAELRRALDDANPLVKRGREVATECFTLERLEDLESWVSDFEFLLTNWVSPQQAVAAAPRISSGDAANKEIGELLRDLPPLPAGWCPTDRRQARILKQPPKS